MLTKKMIAEFIGTFALVFAGCGAIIISHLQQNAELANLVPVSFGLAVGTMIYAVGHISGAHFNPAVPLAFSISRHFPPKEILPYWAAQFFGGIVAIFLLKTTLPESAIYGATLPSVSLTSALIWEIILTFFLMFVIIAVATDTRAEGTLAGLAIGGTVTFCAFVGGSISGASMNPARSFGPAIFQNDLTVIWLYFVGPLIGAILAALTYQFIRCEDKGSEDAAKGCC